VKIQLKRSNVLDSGEAKAPTASQMEYGEIAVNYNTADPVLFIKDSSNGIVRITDSANDGQINVDVGDGLTASGSNATANQEGDTTRVLAIDETWLLDFNNNNNGNGEINVNAGNGLTATGTNATANQAGNTTRVLSAVGDAGYGIDVLSTGIRIGDLWTNIPALT
jgi:hypothetical protein